MAVVIVGTVDTMRCMGAWLRVPQDNWQQDHTVTAPSWCDDIVYAITTQQMRYEW